MVRAAELVLRSVDPHRTFDDGLEPAAVVSFHPLLNRAGEGAETPGHAGPLITAVTDLVDVHAFWASPTSTW